jgi:malate dehydrogenase
MTREELIGVNAGIVKEFAKHPFAFTQCHFDHREQPDGHHDLSGTAIERIVPNTAIIGMGGTLDSSRFKYQLSLHLGCSSARS